MKHYIIFLIFMNLLSCNERNDFATNRKITMEKYMRDAILRGDETAYGSYLEYAENNNIFLDKLSLSLIMNHKHKTEMSYRYIFQNMIELSNNNKYKVEYLKNMDEVDRNYALHYLIEGAKINEISCQTILEKIYRNGIGIEKNLKKSDSLFTILENSSLKEFYRANKNNKSKIDSAIQ